MDWDRVRIFHAAADAGSFTKAGEELNLSQSAVSRQVGALEEELKVPLFHRHARGLILTEQGELLYRAAHDVYSKLESAQTMLLDSREKPSGELRITTTVGLGSNWLTPRVKEFIDLYPDIHLRLMLHDEQLDLSMRQADAAVWLRKPTQPDLIQRKLFTVHFHIYASPDYLKRFGTPRSVADLDNHRIMAFGIPVPNYLEELNWLEKLGRPEGSPRTPTLWVNNTHALRRAVEQGIGLAILPDYLIREDSPLVQVLPDAAMPEFDSYFVYPEEMRESKRLMVFRDFLISKARTWSF
jgi:DNA-binding transcriptional LysR family regulator